MPANRKAFERHLRQHGAWFVRHGRKHDIWMGPNGHESSVPRHKEVADGTARAICRQLGIADY